MDEKEEEKEEDDIKPEMASSVEKEEREGGRARDDKEVCGSLYSFYVGGSGWTI